MLSRENISACSGNCQNDTKAMCGQKVEFLGAIAIFAKSYYELSHACLSVRPPAWNNLAPTGRIFKKKLIFQYF